MIKEQAFELFCEAYGFDNLVPIIMSRLDQDAKLKSLNRGPVKQAVAKARAESRALA